MADRFITPSQFPNAPEGKVAIYKDLSGGLNLWELDYKMDARQSPDMKNLWWCDGLLSCRDGQEYVSKTILGKGICCYDKPFWGHMVAHISDGLYAALPGADMELKKLCDGLPEFRGTFVRYEDALIYKTRGAYKKILWDGQTLTAQDIEPYVPVIMINTTPEGAGDLYQPENRLSPKKTVWFTAARTSRQKTFSVTSVTERVTIVPEDEPVTSVDQVYLDTALLDPSQYSLSEDLCTIYVDVSKTAVLTVVYTTGKRLYRLPSQELDSIEQVLVDDEEVTDYTVDLKEGTITFKEPPPVQMPPVNNSVKITYRKENKDAYNAVMDCCYACTYGGTGGAVLIMAGSTKQPNAYFWNGSHVAMDMGYFPMSYYNLAGDDLEPVTGFGQQAGYLMILKAHAVGKCLLSSTTIDDRAYLSLDYTQINVTMGCDLPWTIRLVENNLVWCSTYAGVCRLEETTPALENQVRCISRNVLGCDARPGLLQAVRDAESVCALEDGDHYWVVADGKAYVWDHAVSSASKPSWFYFTNIGAVSFFRADTAPTTLDDGFDYTGARRLYHLNAQGQVSRFVRTFRDYGEGIDKVYTFATQDFGSVERQKHIKKLLLTTRSDTDTIVQLQYSTDHAVRRELTPVRSLSWRLLPRDLTFRFLGVRRFAQVAVRVPGCRYVRHFSLRLSNDRPGCDLSPVSAEIYADFVIKER